MKNLYKKTLSLGLSILCLCFAISASAQDVTLHFKAAPLQKVIDAVSKQSKFNFLFDAEFLKKANPVTIDADRMSVQKVLPLIFAGQPFNYKVTGKSIILTQKVSSQNVTEDEIIHGMVTDSLGAGLPGVSVLLKGTAIAGQTDATGHFLLRNTGANKTVIIRYVGYRSQEVTANGSENLNVKLQMESYGLNDVFVNGFQQISKERTTAAYTKLTNEDLNRNLNVDLISALEGKVAGLINQKNKNGAAADKMILRGVATFSTTIGPEPLLVIDGLPTEYTLEDVNPYDIESVTVLKDAAAASIYGARSANGVIIMTTKQGTGKGVKLSLNTDLFITTKPNLDAMHYASTSQLIDWETAKYQQELANTTSVENMFLKYGSIGNGTLAYYSPLYQLYRDQAAGAITTDRYNTTLNQFRQNDYIKDYTDHVWQNEVRQRYNLSLSSATDRNNTYVSLNYDQGKGRIINNLNKTFNLNLKSTFKVKSWLSATIGFNGRYSNDDATDGTYNNLFLQERYARIVDENGNLVNSDYANVSDGFSTSSAINGSVIKTIAGNTAFKSFGFNVVDALGDGISNTKATSLRTFANIEAQLYKGLSFNTQVQYEISNSHLERFTSADGYSMRYATNMFTSVSNGVYTYALDPGERYYQLNKSNSTYTFRNQLNYNYGFGKDKSEHYIAALAGFEMRQIFSPMFNESLRYGFNPITLQSANINELVLFDNGVGSYFNGTRKLSELGNSNAESKHRFTSMFANMSYTYLRKYSVTGSVRQDNSDLFGVDYKDKTRPFYSLGLAWNASYEDFLKNEDWLNMLKVRATYGTNGNVDPNTNKYITVNTRSNALLTNLTYLNVVNFPNPLLRWETTATTNFGVDYAVFNNRLRGTIDFYNRSSKDLLVTTQLDPTVGTLTQKINSGAIRNRGLELSASGDWFKNKDWTLTSIFTFATNKNQVLKQNNTSTTASVYISAPTDYFFTGAAYNTMYAYKFGGMVNGYPYFLDENGNPNMSFDANGVPIVTSIKAITNPAALVKVGQLDPKYSGSFSQRIRYKNFELNAMLVYSGGNQLRKDVTALDAYDVTDVDIATRWTAGSDFPRLKVDYPQALLNSASTLSSMWKYADNQILDATYVKLRNLGLSYNMPRSINNKLGIAGLKLTVQANNLWYWSAAGDDIDPEAYSLNTGTRSYPIPKSFLIGLNVTF